MEFTLEESEVKVKEEPTDTSTQRQIQIDLINDWESDGNEECRVAPERIQNILPEIQPSSESHVTWRTFSGPEADKGQDETDPGLELDEEFIRDTVENETRSTDDEIDIKYEGSGIEYNSTTNAEGDHRLDPDHDSVLPNLNPKSGNQCHINSEQIDLSEFYLRLLQCEQDCETCQKYIRKLSEHIRATHGACQPHPDPLLIDPDQSSVIEIKREVVDEIEGMDCSQKSESDPDYNIEDGGDSDPDYAPSPVLAAKVCLPNTNSRHISTVPTGDKRYGSEGSGKGKKKQSEMRFKCTDCDKGYATKSLLAMHMRTHTGERPFKCRDCEKSYLRKAHLEYHIRTHTGEKPFKCDLCPKAYTRSNSLTIHKKDHIGDRPFQCDECNKSYSQRCNLNYHARTHTRVKPFKCDLCLKCFSTKAYMTVHMRSHTGEKPFKCDECNQSYVQMSSLIYHKRSHGEGKTVLV